MFRWDLEALAVYEYCIYCLQKNPSLAELTWREALGHARFEKDPKNKAVNEENTFCNHHTQVSFIYNR